MKKSNVFKPKSSSYKVSANVSIERTSSNLRQASNEGRNEDRVQKQSGVYDVRFKRKDLRDFDPKHYITASISEDDVIQLKQVFDYYDTTKMGVLLPNDLKRFLEENGFHAKKQTIYEIIAEFDQQETGGISFFEFMKAMDSKPYEKEKKKDIFHIFKKYDRANKGYINMQDLKEKRDLEIEIDEEMMKLMIERASKGNGDKIKFEDFYEVMRKQVY